MSRLGLVVAVFVLIGLIVGCEKPKHAGVTTKVSPARISGFSYDAGSAYAITPEGDIYYRSLINDEEPRLIGNFWSGRGIKR